MGNKFQDRVVIMFMVILLFGALCSIFSFVLFVTIAMGNDELEYEERQVTGVSENGEYVVGDVNIEDGRGDGVVYNEEQEEIYIEVDPGLTSRELRGYGEDGKYYDLEVEPNW